MTAPQFRVGLGLGLGETWRTAEEFTDIVRTAEVSGWDSLWFSEHLTGGTPAQIPQLAFAAAVTSRIRIGTSITVVPGRSPVDLARNLSTLNLLAEGRLLPIFGLGIAEPDEHSAFNVKPEQRGRWLDESLPVLRRLTDGDSVTHHSDLFELDDISLRSDRIRPITSFWMGGRSRTELRRAGRLADGWLASFSTPEETAAGIREVKNAAQAAGRSVDEDHYGLLFPYARHAHKPAVREILARAHPGVDHSTLAPVGPRQLADTLRRHARGGVSKFVLVPSEETDEWATEVLLCREDVDVALASI